MVGLRQPFDFIDLLFDLQGLEVIELRLMTCKGAVYIVLNAPLSSLWVQVVGMAVDAELSKGKTAIPISTKKKNAEDLRKQGGRARIM